MLTAAQRDTIRQRIDAESRARAKRTIRVEQQLDRDRQEMEAEVTETKIEEQSENGATAEWTRETVIAAMLRWRDVRGSLPTSAEWQQRHEGYPTYTTVRKFFEGWTDALAAAEKALTATATRARVGPILPEPAPTGTLALIVEEFEAAHAEVEEAEAHYEEVLGRLRAHPLMALVLEEAT